MKKEKLKSKMQKDFNIVICGTGGQGVITLQKIIVEAAHLAGFDVKASELHGLSQRGGSVESHIRFGEKIFSPLVRQGGADLIISLEAQEAVRACYYGSRENKTAFLVNNFFTPIIFQKENYSKDKIAGILQKFSDKVIFVDAHLKSMEQIGSPVAAGVYMIGFASYGSLFPVSPEALTRGMGAVLKPEHYDLNKKIFNSAKER